MAKTKEIILDTALRLFNDRGLSKVTLRTIANEMGISQGNLNYHYKKREDIIESLYFRLVGNIDDMMSQINQDLDLFSVMFLVSEKMMSSFFDYRFFLTDFVQIIRENEVIRNHYSALVIQREHQFIGIFNTLIAQGYMREEIFEGEYKNLFMRFQILGSFWIPSTVILSEELNKAAVNRYCNLLNEMIIPYLTARGQKAYQDHEKITFNV